MRFGPDRDAVIRRTAREILEHGTASIDTCLDAMSAGIDPRGIAFAEHLVQLKTQTKETE